MKWSNIVLVVFVLIRTISSAQIVIRTSKSDKSTELIVESVVNILASCYENEESTIGVSGSFPETFFRTLWSRKMIPIVLMNHENHKDVCSIFEPNCSVLTGSEAHYKKLKVFAMTATTATEFSSHFGEIFCSGWFNRHATFFIVDWSHTSTYGCDGDRITGILNAAWVLRIPNVNILCLNSSAKQIIYSYNPYTDRAPLPWRFTNLYKSSVHENLRFFKREYRRRDVCENLYYDKTIDLIGVPIEYTNFSMNSGLVIAGTRSNNVRTLARKRRADNVILNFIRVMKGTPKAIWSISTVTRCQMAIAVSNADYRMELSPNFLSYPFLEKSILIMTNFHGYKSQLEKILTVIDVYSRIGTVTIILVTMIFFKLVVGQSLIAAFLNVVRMTCNTGFTNLPVNNVTRIFMTGLFCFIVTIHGIFSGNLASLLTMNMPVEHPTSLQDLVNGNYTIAVSYHDIWYFELREEKGRLTPIDSLSDHCIRHMIGKGTSMACLSMEYEVLDLAEAYDIYFCKIPVYTGFYSIAVGTLFPFDDKLNEVILSMAAGDIFDTLETRVAIHRLNFVEVDEGPKVMNLKNVGFGFAILGIGLAFATLCFVLEISIRPIRSAIATRGRRRYDWFRWTKSEQPKDETLKVKRIKVRTLNV